MTLAEYKANPSSWTPTFTVANVEDYMKWKSKADGAVYERVLVSANISATYGIDLDYSQTKQVVFSNNALLTLIMTEDFAKCFYRSSQESSAELWMYKPYIDAYTNTFTQDICGFYNCNNIESPTIKRLNPHIGEAGRGLGGGSEAYGFYQCDNIIKPTITLLQGGTHFYADGDTGTTFTPGGEAYGFYKCSRIEEPVITALYGGNGFGAHGALGYGFYNCKDINKPTITKLYGGGNGYSSVPGSGNDGIGFYGCENIILPVIKELYGGGGNGSIATIGNAYGFYNCKNIDRPNIEKMNGENGAKGKAYGFYGCREVKNPTATLSTSTNPSYVHYLWSGLIENVIANAKTAVFYPAYGPYSLLWPDSPSPGQEVYLSWMFITSVGNGATANAVLQVTFDRGETWTTIYSGPNTSYTYTVPTNIESIQFRVYADALAYAYTELLEFTALPVISGTDQDLGTLTSFSPYDFFISKASEDKSAWSAAVINIALDKKSLQTFNLAIGTEKTIVISPFNWSKVSNGFHTLRIEAFKIIDGEVDSEASVRTLTFTRAQNRAVISLTNPALVFSKPEQIRLAIGGVFPDGSSLTVETCNNAHDEDPVWEDMTDEWQANESHVFTNSEKTAETWGVNIRLTLERGTAVGFCYINSVTGNFEI